MLVRDFSVVKEPNVVFQAVTSTSSRIGISDFSNQTEVIVQGIVVVYKQRYFSGNVDVPTGRVDPVSLRYGGVIFFFRDYRVFLEFSFLDGPVLFLLFRAGEPLFVAWYKILCIDFEVLKHKSLYVFDTVCRKGKTSKFGC